MLDKNHTLCLEIGNQSVNVTEDRAYAVSITPDAALELLAANTSNRPVIERAVEDYTREMTRGRWAYNGVPIVISKTGVILDGQHRLLACIRSGREFKTVIHTGIEDAAFTTIDRGRKRTAGDILAIQGYSHGNKTAAAVGWFLLATDETVTSRRNLTLTSEDILRYVEREPIIAEAAARWRRCRIIAPSMAAGLYAAFARKDRVLADDFMEQLETGGGMVKGGNMHRLRSRLEVAQTSNDRTLKIHPEDACAMVIRTWNAERRGQFLSRIYGAKAREGGTYPKVI